MSNILNNIRTLLTSLPSKDVHFGNMFLDNRNFESLKELVDSAIIRTKKNIRSEHPKEEYTSVNLDRLTTLQAEVEVYLLQLELPEIEEEEEEEEEEDYYDE